MCLFTIMKTFSNILCKVVARHDHVAQEESSSSNGTTPRCPGSRKDARFDILSGNCSGIPVRNLQAELVPPARACHYADFVLGK